MHDEGVGGQENELFANTINLIIPKLRESHRRVIDRLISSRSVYSLNFGRTLGHGAITKKNVSKTVNKLVSATSVYIVFILIMASLLCHLWYL